MPDFELARNAPGLVQLTYLDLESDIFEGEPKVQPYDESRVFSDIFSLEGHLCLLLYQGNRQPSDKKISDFSEIRNIRRAFSIELASIGMIGEYAHPFPNNDLYMDGSISALVMDELLYQRRHPANFPILKNQSRIATAKIIPHEYLSGVQHYTRLSKCRITKGDITEKRT